jgi:tight adherence protein C
VSLSALGAALGLTSGAGLAIGLRGCPPMRRPRLDDRIAPYLPEGPRPSRLLSDSSAWTPFGAAERLFGPATRDLARRVDGWMGGSASVRHRLARAGRAPSVERFRVEQVLWAAAGFGGGVALAVFAAARGGRRSPAAFVVLACVFAVFGVMLRDRALTSEVRRREARMAAEFPTVAELLALAVGAGEGPLGALERVARCAGGALSAELRRVLADTRAGTGIVAALEALGARTGLPAVTRFVDGMAVAVERGTPLADVLRAQANDAREEGRRTLLEAGGRKEIAMLVPVVFFVLPVTVVFALFPGFYGLRLAVP